MLIPYSERINFRSVQFFCYFGGGQEIAKNCTSKLILKLYNAKHFLKARKWIHANMITWQKRLQNFALQGDIKAVHDDRFVFNKLGTSDIEIYILKWSKH